MQALVFGAGNIGRGFLGQLLWEGSYEITFVDIDQPLVTALNDRKGYPLRLVDGQGPTQNIQIDRVSAIDARNTEGVCSAFSRSDLVLTSVGVSAFDKLAPVIAAGIMQRRQTDVPVDILLCENQWRASEMMLELLLPRLSGDERNFLETSVGLVEVVVGRMVPRPSKAVLAEDPLLVVAEPYHLLPCAKEMFRAGIPPVSGLEAEDNFDAYVARKLYLQVAGHAAFAYLGYPGHEFIWQCVEDSTVLNQVEPALDEAERALAAKFGFKLDDLREFTAEMLQRYRNEALGDTVERVAQDPMRKLRPEDRLIGAANMCLECGITPIAFARIIRSALRYDNPHDAAAVTMQRRIEEQGMLDFLRSHCKIAPNSELERLILTSE